MGQVLRACSTLLWLSSQKREAISLDAGKESPQKLLEVKIFHNLGK